MKDKQLTHRQPSGLKSFKILHNNNYWNEKVMVYADDRDDRLWR